MDTFRFDTFTRALHSTRSRRAAFVGLFALLNSQGDEDAAAHDALLTCKKLKGDRKRKCLKKARKHMVKHKPATCSDGVQNGSETGVDCGGSCPPCTTGQGCATPNDCASALCSGGTCQTCTESPDTCGSDANGTCVCRRRDSDGSYVCVKNEPVAACFTTACPAGTVCFEHFSFKNCHRACGAP